MRALARIAGVVVSIAAAAGVAAADPTPLEAGLIHFHAQDYVAARRELGSVVELGNAEAQALYGLMLREGQGGERDTAAAIGWMLASADNGFTQLVDQLPKLNAALAGLAPEQRTVASDIAQRFGSKRLFETLIPSTKDLLVCSRAQHVFQFEEVLPEYPRGARRVAQDADVAIDMRVGTDGLAHEPDVTGAFPGGDEFAEPTVRAILRSRFLPARFDGTPIDATWRVNQKFRIIGGGTLWNDAGVRKAIDQANAGSVAAQFLVGSATILDPSEFRMNYVQGLQLLVRAAQAGHAEAQYRVATELTRHSLCAPSAKSGRWLALAVAGGSERAQLSYARQLLASEPDAERRTEAKRLLISVAKSGSPFPSRLAAGILATSTFEDIRDPVAAIAAMKAIRDDTYDMDPLTWEARAAASAGTGKFSDAVSEQQRAIKLASEYRWNTTAMLERLVAYQHDKAWTGNLFEVPAVPPPGPPPSRVEKCAKTNYKPPCVHIAEPPKFSSGPLPSMPPMPPLPAPH